MDKNFDDIIQTYTPHLKQQGLADFNCYELYLVLLFWIYISHQADNNDPTWNFLEPEYRFKYKLADTDPLKLKAQIVQTVEFIKVKHPTLSSSFSLEITRNVEAELLKNICLSYFTALGPDWIWSRSNLTNLFSILETHFAQATKESHLFFTPAEVVHLITSTIPFPKGESLYDPYCRDNSFLLSAVAEMKNRDFKLTADTDNVFSYRMSMLKTMMLGFSDADIGIRDINGGHPDKKFDYIVTNPPFGRPSQPKLKHAPDAYWTSTFSDINSEVGFVCHSIDHLAEGGSAGIVVPSGLLSHRGRVAVFREELVRSGMLEAVISLPPNLFYTTRIAAAILILHKTKLYDQVLLLNATKLGSYQSNRFQLSDKDINLLNNIVKEYRNERKIDVSKWMNIPGIIGIDELKSQDFNLNLPTYRPSPTSSVEPFKSSTDIQNEILFLYKEWDHCRQKIDQLFRPK